MAAQRIRYDSERMQAAANNVRNLAQQYNAAASQFNNSFESATAEWEGASKEKMLAFVEGPVNKYLSDTVQQVLDALAKLLEENARQMQEADEELARNIPESLG